MQRADNFLTQLAAAAKLRPPWRSALIAVCMAHCVFLLQLIAGTHESFQEFAL
jgi:hypothetical protein